MKEKGYRLDRTAFSAMSMQEADSAMNDYRSYSWKERLAVAAYLNSISYNYPLNNAPKMEKHLFTALSVFK